MTDPAAASEGQNKGRRRLDRILRDDYLDGLDGLQIEEVRRRRDECLAEREFLSYLRRLYQGRLDILEAELQARRSGDERPLVDRLAEIMSSEGSSQGSPRGEAVRFELPDEEVLAARRRYERLANDAAISDPGSMDEAQLDEAAETLREEERVVSDTRSRVLQAHDALQDEIKRRYREQFTSAQG